MRVVTTYFIIYDNGNKSAWLAEGVSPESFENVTEVTERLVLKADTDKTLWFINTEEPYEVGQSIWLKDTTEEEYEERDWVEPEPPIVNYN